MACLSRARRLSLYRIAQQAQADLQCEHVCIWVLFLLSMSHYVEKMKCVLSHRLFLRGSSQLMTGPPAAEQPASPYVPLDILVARLYTSSLAMYEYRYSIHACVNQSAKERAAWSFFFLESRYRYRLWPLFCTLTSSTSNSTLVGKASIEHARSIISKTYTRRWPVLQPRLHPLSSLPTLESSLPNARG